MRISDWSSDVCSSDLAQVGLSRFVVTGGNAPPVLELAEQALDEVAPAVLRTVVRDWRATVALGGDHRLDIGLGVCVAVRNIVVLGKSVSVRVFLVCCLFLINISFFFFFFSFFFFL